MKVREMDPRFQGLLAAFVVVGAMAIVAIGIAAVYVGLRAGDQSAENAELIKTVVATNEQLLDCTEPGGRCFEDSQKRTGEAVTGIGENTFRVIVAALSCQNDGIVQERALAKCTAKRLQIVEIPRN